MERDVRADQITLWRKIFPHGHYIITRNWLENESETSKFLNNDVRNIILFIMINITMVASVSMVTLFGCCLFCCRRKSIKNVKIVKQD